MGRYISNTNTSSYQGNELLLLKQGIAKNRKEFLTAGTDTWTIDHDVIVRVRVWGGGGGGGGCGGSWSNEIWIPGAGGGAGGAAEAILRLSAGAYNITVGPGGAGGTNGNNSSQNITSGKTGGVGGSSSFHTYITCSGGLGGIGGGYQTGWVAGGAGGTVLFDWNGFDGLLYVDSRFGGAGGSCKSGTAPVYTGSSLGYRALSLGSEGGAGESGGQAGYDGPFMDGGTRSYMGGGGGGYNAPFIYGTNMSVLENSGRGVGAGGAGAGSVGGSRPGNSGAVVIEWN